MPSFKEYWWAYGLGAVGSAALIYGLYYFLLAPPWTGINCGNGWTQRKWDAFKAWFSHNHSADGQSPDWYRWMVESLNEPHYSRSKVDVDGICDAANVNHWKVFWEEFRGVHKLRPDGSPMKEGEKWTYQGPHTCLRGFPWDRYLWIKRAWLEAHEGLFHRVPENMGATTAKEAADGAKWLWETVGDKEWAQSFGSDTISVQHFCDQIQGQRDEEDFFPDFIEHTANVEYIGSLGNPEEMGGAPRPGTYIPGNDIHGFHRNPTSADLIDPPARGGKSEKEILKEAFTLHPAYTRGVDDTANQLMGDDVMGELEDFQNPFDGGTIVGTGSGSGGTENETEDEGTVYDPDGMTLDEVQMN